LWTEPFVDVFKFAHLKWIKLFFKTKKALYHRQNQKLNIGGISAKTNDKMGSWWWKILFLNR
jgi:hypothetical protein